VCCQAQPKLAGGRHVAICIAPPDYRIAAKPFCMYSYLHRWEDILLSGRSLAASWRAAR
jgi:hypothetical protein